MGTAGGVIASVGREDASPCGVLVSKLIRRVGLDENDIGLREIAQDHLNESIDEFNIETSWMDRLLVQDTTLVASQDEYTLAARFRETIGRAWIVDSSLDRILPLEVLSYHKFLQRIPDDRVSAGSIRFVTVRNRVDGGVFQVFPAPNSTWITTNPTIRLIYFADIPHCVEDSDSIGVSATLEKTIWINALATFNDEVGDIEKALRFIRRAEVFKSKIVGWNNKQKLKSTLLEGVS